MLFGKRYWRSTGTKKISTKVKRKEDKRAKEVEDYKGRAGAYTFEADYRMAIADQVANTGAPPFHCDSTEDSPFSDLMSNFIRKIMELLLLALKQHKMSQDIILLCMTSVLPVVKLALSSTIPWSISIALAVLWDVCWMLAEYRFDSENLDLSGFDDTGLPDFCESSSLDSELIDN